MAKWTPAPDPPDLTPRPAFGIGHHHPPPPHVITYHGLVHISAQIEEVQMELAEIKAILARICASSEE